MKSKDIESAFLPEEELKKQEKEESKKKAKNFVEKEIDKMGAESPEPMDKDLLMIKEMIKELTNLNELDTKTELTTREILLFARLQVYSEVFGLPVLKDFATSVYRKKLSKSRGLRKELLQAISQLQHTEGENATSFPDLLIGKSK